MIAEKEFLGLSNEEAEKRIKKYGLNAIKQKEKISSIKIFLSQFNDFITWILIAATIISGITGEKADAITILVIVIMNGVLGFLQEYKTEKSLDALKQMAAPTSKVIRNGKVVVMNAEYITVGDTIVLESGDRIPADCIVTQCSNMVIDESLLTGESVGVNKTTKNGENSIFMGTIVLNGKGLAQVVEIGMGTEMGKIAHMLNEIEKERSPLREKLNGLGKILVILCLIICGVVTILGISRGNDIKDMFLLGVSLAVAAIPEGLGAIVTVALALGVSKMLKKKALVRKLPAVETLGCTSIICSDKTGTLTYNNMTVKALYYDNILKDVNENQIKDNTMLMKAFVFCNDCNIDFKEMNLKKGMMGDPTETALIKAFFKTTAEVKNFMQGTTKLYDNPFDSDRKMMSVIVKDSTKKVAYVKGAPEKIIDRCRYALIEGKVVPMTSNIKNDIMKAVETMSYKALRCLAGAYKVDNLSNNLSIEKDLIFIGIAGIIDPPRPEVKDAVWKCRIAGIKPVMITGDHKNTAFAIGKELHICKDINEVMIGEDLDKINDKELEKRLDKVSIFARVTPNHKLRIVRAFKNKGKIVAMTGDGVNDAPAVKEADIGIAMGISGTDVTKEAASMILMDDNFSTIVAAVEEGRVIYNNIRKFIRYLLSCNLGEVLTMFLASLLNIQSPLLAIQILFVNLATDGLPAIALGVDPGDDDIMTEKPREKHEGIFARGLIEKILIRGSLIGICTVLSFLIGAYFGFTVEACRTMALSTLVISQLIHVFECKSERHSLFEINIFTNMYLVGAVLISVMMLVGVIYIPFFQTIFKTVALDLGKWAIVLAFSLSIAFINGIYLFFSKK